jgi:hypothetical protein
MLSLGEQNDVYREATEKWQKKVKNARVYLMKAERE